MFVSRTVVGNCDIVVPSCEEAPLSEPTTPGMRDGRELIGSMGWEPLPYGCVGIARNAETRAGRLWSWLMLIPWAVNDSKPWVDGTTLIADPTMSETLQRAQVLAEMREILDKRYGEAVAGQAAEDFLRKLQEE